MTQVPQAERFGEPGESMRITSNMIAQSEITSIQSNLAALNVAQEQVSSGLKFQNASDDPSAARQVMATQSSLAALAQYQTNVQAATSRVTQEDSVLQQINNLLDSATSLGVSQATGTATAQTRAVTNAQVQQIFSQLIDLGNTKIGDEYLFGGQQSTTTPFASSGSGAALTYTSTNPTGQRAVSIGDGQTIAATHDGTQVFISSGVLDSIKQLSQALDSSSPTYGQAGISAALNSIANASNSLQTIIGETGANEQQLTTTTQNLQALSTNVTTLQSNLQDVDLEQAMTELTTRQTAYQAAMVAMSKISNLTLSNYLQ